MIEELRFQQERMSKLEEDNFDALADLKKKKYEVVDLESKNRRNEDEVMCLKDDIRQM